MQFVTSANFAERSGLGRWETGADRQTEKCSKERVGHDGPRKLIFTDLQVIS
jgi:hypothetical protein